jgi:hypothetical protein
MPSFMTVSPLPPAPWICSTCQHENEDLQSYCIICQKVPQWLMPPDHGRCAVLSQNCPAAALARGRKGIAKGSTKGSARGIANGSVVKALGTPPLPLVSHHVCWQRQRLMQALIVCTPLVPRCLWLRWWLSSFLTPHNFPCCFSSCTTDRGFKQR